MQEENKGDKIRRVLQLYAKLSDGYVINKAEEAAYYGVTERSITRDIDDIRNFLDEDSERTGIVNNVVYDRMAKGYRLETLYKIRLQNSEVLALCKILLDSRAFTKNEMVSMLDKLITCCVPKVNQKRVKELIQNEEFHYVEPKHGNEFIDLMWDLGQAINESRYIEIDYLRTKDKAIVHRRLNKVSQALDDVIPLCVFGNYSAGKSTFINALIGVELLPSGGDPVTAKIYEIRNSEFFDQAKISFEFHGERIEISIEGKEFRVLKGDSETDIVKSIKEEIDNEGSHELYAMVRIAMDILNNYEKKDKEVTEIGSVITLVVPFSTSGVIGNSSNKFVIFDTPGSNSNSNQDHAKVLAEAMDGFSNGMEWLLCLKMRRLRR